MATIRRNKYGKIHYAVAFAGVSVVGGGNQVATITGWSDDPAAAAEIDEPLARAIVDAHKARNSPNGGQLAALDAKGKTIALWGEPGEPPAPPKPVASLPGLAEQVAKLEERVELIEQADKAGGVGGIVTEPLTESQTKEIEAALAKAVKGMPLLLKSDVPPPSFTAEEVASLKGMLGEWAAHKAKESPKDDRKEPAKTSTAAAGGASNAKAG